MPRQSDRDRGREILSAANPLLKIFRRALAEGATRQGWLALEGPLSLQEALRAERAVVRSVLAGKNAAQKFRGLLGKLPPGAELAVVSERLFEHVASTETPQGIAALVELRPPDFEALLQRPQALLLVACGVQDPGNLGTMMRSAQALGATALVTLRETVSPFNPKALRASAGAVLRLPVFPGREPGALLEDLRRAGIRRVAADRRSPSSLAQADLRGPVAFLIGREAAGLPPEIARRADLLLSIPIGPETDSLNAATAASIFLYEAARQRGFHY
jgi:RNA methyltransferase, TrmH family